MKKMNEKKIILSNEAMINVRGGEHRGDGSNSGGGSGPCRDRGGANDKREPRCTEE